MTNAIKSEKEIAAAYAVMHAAAAVYADRKREKETKRQTRLQADEAFRKAINNYREANLLMESLFTEFTSLQARMELVNKAILHYETHLCGLNLELLLNRDALDAEVMSGNYGAPTGSNGAPEEQEGDLENAPYSYTLEIAAKRFAEANWAQRTYSGCPGGISPAVRAKWDRAKAERMRLEPLLADAKAAYDAQEALLGELTKEVDRARTEVCDLQRDGNGWSAAEEAREALHEAALVYSALLT